MPPQLLRESVVYGTDHMTQALQRLESLDYSPSKWPQIKAHLGRIACFNSELTQDADQNGQEKVPNELDLVIDGRMPADVFATTMRTWRLSTDALTVQKYKLCLNAFLDEVKEFQKLPTEAALLIGQIIGSLLKGNAVSNELAFVLKLMLSDWLREVGSSAFNATISALRELGPDYLRSDYTLSHRLRHSPGYPFLPPELGVSVNFAEDHKQQLSSNKSGPDSSISALPLPVANGPVMNGAHTLSDSRSNVPGAGTNAEPTSTTSTTLTSLLGRLTTRAQAPTFEAKNEQTKSTSVIPQNLAAGKQPDLNDVNYTTEWLLPLDFKENSAFNNDTSKTLSATVHDKIAISDPNPDAVDKILFICNQLNESMISQHVPLIMKVCREQIQRKYNGRMGEFILWLAWYITLERARVEENYQELYLNLLTKLSSSGLTTILPACANMCAYFLVLALDLPHDMRRLRLDLKMDATKTANFLGLVVSYRKSGAAIPDFLEPCRLIETMRHIVARSSGTNAAVTATPSVSSTDDAVIPNSGDAADGAGDIVAQSTSAPAVNRQTSRFMETVLAIACAMLKNARVPGNGKNHSNRNSVAPPTEYLLRQLRYLRQYHDECHEQARFEIERLFEALRIKLNDPSIVANKADSDKAKSVRVITRAELPQLDANKSSPSRPASKASVFLLPDNKDDGSKEVLSPDNFNDGVFEPNSDRRAVEAESSKPVPSVEVAAKKPIAGQAGAGYGAFPSNFGAMPAVSNNGESSFYVTAPDSLSPELPTAGSPMQPGAFVQNQVAAQIFLARQTPPNDVDPAIVSTGIRSRDQTPTSANVAKSALAAGDLAVAESSPHHRITLIAPSGAADISENVNARNGGAPGLNNSVVIDVAAEQQLRQNLPKLTEKLLKELSGEADAGGLESSSSQSKIPSPLPADAAISSVNQPEQRRLPIFLPGDDIWWDREELRNVAPLRPPTSVRTPEFRWDLGMSLQPGAGYDEHWLSHQLGPLLEALVGSSAELRLLRDRLLIDTNRKTDLMQILLANLQVQARRNAELFKNSVPRIIAPTVALITCKDFAFDVDPKHVEGNGSMNARYLSSALIDCMFRSKLRAPLHELLCRVVMTEAFEKLSPESRHIFIPDMRTSLEGFVRYMTDECGAVLVQYVQYKAIRYSILEMNYTPSFQNQVVQRHQLVASCNNDISAAAGAHLAQCMDQIQAVNAKLPLRLRYKLDGMPPPDLTGPYNIIRSRVHGFVNNFDFVTRQPLP